MLSVQNVTFSRTMHGYLCITFDDAAFARADVIFINPASREISAFLDGLHVKIGTVPTNIDSNFIAHDSVLLTAPHPEGHDVALLAPLRTIH